MPPDDKTAGRVICDDALLSSGFTRIPNVVLKDRELSIGARLTYGALLAYLYPAGRYPGQRAMAEEYGFSERSALSYLKELEARGFLRVTRHGLGVPNTYEILCPWRENPDPQNLRVLAAESAVPARNGCGSLEQQDVGTEDSLSDAWFAALGQSSPSRQQRERASRVIHDLTAQGYSAEAIRQAIGLAVARGARSPDLLPHLMGEAAVLASQSTRSRAQMSPGSPAAAPLDVQATEALSDALAAVDALSAPDRAALESRAREHLPPGLSEAGLQRALPGAMARLLADSGVPG